MNILSAEKQTAAIAALCEGVSIRGTERLTGIHRDSIMRLGVRVGRGCERIHDGMMRGLNVARIELDEAWSYVGKKQRALKPEDGPDLGDQYVFLALDATGKAILSYQVGKRTSENTMAFLSDLRRRIVNAPEISSDAFAPYEATVEAVFGADCHYGQIIKHYRAEPVTEGERRFSPSAVVGVSRAVMIGSPKRISTSYVERQNLTLRMGQRRFTRLSNAFSKKRANHRAAVALYVAHYNLCRVHEALRFNPAMALGVTDHIWTIGELVEKALNPDGNVTIGRRVGRFTVIEGGLS